MTVNFSDLVFIDSTGYHYADFPTIQNWLIGQYQSVYGADVYLGSDSQDGQWVGIQAQGYYDVATVGAATYNSFSPVTAQGVGLSRVVKINGVTRESPSNSTVDLVIGGTTGTTLTNAIAIDDLNQQWSIPTLTIPMAGTITITATAIAAGAIAALPNTITGIFTPTSGWQTVNNPSAATTGNPVEIDAALRARQARSVAIPSLTVFDGTVGAVQNVAGVSQAVGYENPTNSTDGNGLPPHSVAIVADGGTDIAVAQAIQVHKTPGTQTVGTTTVLVQDSHGMPINIHFYRPTDTTINIGVTVVIGAGWDSSTETLIKNALAAQVTYPNVPIGGKIILTQLYAVAYLVGTPQYGTFTVAAIEISQDLDPLGTSNIILTFLEEPQCDPTTDVTVTT